MAGLSSVLQWFVECRHHNRSRVFTINNRTYQTCLNCGREITYAWEHMGSVPHGCNVSRATVQGTTGAACEPGSGGSSSRCA
jgi:hypothetical protein